MKQSAHHRQHSTASPHVSALPPRARRATLGATHTVPAASGYEFEEVFHGGFGRAGFEDDEHRLKHFDEPVMDEALKLDEAKRAAAKAVTELISVQARFPRAAEAEDDPEEWREPHEAAVLAERVVVKCRIAMLNRMLRFKETNMVLRVLQDPNSDEPALPVHTSVQYRRLQTAGAGTKMFALQSPQVWMSSWPWILGQNLFTTENSDGLFMQLNMVVASTMKSTIKTLATRELRAMLNRLLQETANVLTLNFTSSPCDPKQMAEFRKWQPSESYNEGIIVHTAESYNIYEGHRIKVEVIVGALRINYCDQWHNPLINEFAQNAVLQSAQDSVAKKVTSDNAVKITIVLSHRGAVHVLDLAPTITPDMCCVKHMHISDDQGILALNDKQITEVPQPEPKSAAYAWYYCPGAHKNQRLNEQQLHAIHATAFRFRSDDVHIRPLDTDHLPDPNDLLDGSAPPAKSARISFTDYDVLITSYATPHERDGHKCKTVITLVRYPPVGMQYIKDAKPPPPQQVVIREVQVPAPYSSGGRHQAPPPPKRKPFKELPPPGVMQYIIWYSADAANNWVINLIEHDEDDQEPENTLAMMEYGKETNREIWNAFKDTGLWIASGSKEMVTNIRTNNNQNASGETVRDIYRRKWREYIVEFIEDSKGEDGTFDADGDDEVYLYCKKPEVWDEFIEDLGEQTVAEYRDYSEARFKRDTESKKLDKRGIREQAPTAGTGGPDGARYLGAPLPPPPGKIAIPGGPRQQQQQGGATTPAAVLALVQQMKERIHALEEAKTDDARAGGNTEHLLRQVLSTLATPPARS